MTPVKQQQGEPKLTLLIAFCAFSLLLLLQKVHYLIKSYVQFSNGGFEGNQKRPTRNNNNTNNIYIYIAFIQSSKRFTSDYKFQQLRVLDSPQQQLTYLKH